LNRREIRSVEVEGMEKIRYYKINSSKIEDG
jgi:hypothetical protein